MSDDQATQITEASLAELVRRFYAKAREDRVLGPVFNAAIDDWPPHLAQITAFWATAALGAKTYAGNPLAAHRKHPIQPEMFDRWLELWAETATEVFAPAAASDLIDRARRIAESLKLGLYFRPAS